MYGGGKSNLTSALIDQVNSFTINLLRVAAGTRRTILGQLQELEHDLINKLDRITGKGDFTAARLRTLLAQTKDTIATAYGDMSESHMKDLRGIVKATAKAVEKAVNTEVRVPLINVALSQSRIEEIASKTLIQGAFSNEWWAAQSKSLLSAFTRAMRNGLYQGESIADLTRRIRGTKALGYTDGVMNIPRVQAETLVRTSALTVANHARLASFIQNKDVIDAIQWVATLDSRTTEICMALDGKTWSLPEDGDPENYGGYTPIDHDKEFPGPTAHWGCRSTQVPVIRAFDVQGADFRKNFERRLQDKGFSAAEAKKIKSETRASMDGQVGATVGFDDWLKSKDADFVEEALGKKRADLFLDRKLSISDLTDQHNRPLSVDELDG